MIAKLLHSMHCRLLSSYTLPPKFVVLFSLVAVSSAGNPINKTQTVSACDSGDISSWNGCMMTGGTLSDKAWEILRLRWGWRRCRSWPGFPEGRHDRHSWSYMLFYLFSEHNGVRILFIYFAGLVPHYIYLFCRFGQRTTEPLDDGRLIQRIQTDFVRTRSTVSLPYVYAKGKDSPVCEIGSEDDIFTFMKFVKLF